MRQNLHTGKNVLSNSAKFRVYENSADFSTVCKLLWKESSVDTVAGSLNRFGT
jgi:hypothetical protein